MRGPPIRLPAGVRDFLPRATAQRRAIAERLVAIFEAWGYARIITPAFECADVLELGLGADAQAAAVRFVEPVSGEVVALRPDITPQIARLVATRYRDVVGPIRLCYEGAVTRIGDRGPREIVQAGVELIDAEPNLGDAELVALATEAMGQVGLLAPQLELGHVAPLAHVLAQLPDGDGVRLRQALARKDLRAVAGMAATMPSALQPLVNGLCTLWGPADAVLGQAVRLAWPDKVHQALASLAQVIVDARVLVGPGRALPITIDLGEVRGFDYYTGLRVAGYARGAADAILRGGRYDELVGRYGRVARAVGLAVDVEAVAEAVGLPAVHGPRGLVVVDGDRGRAAVVARALRGQGVRVTLAPSSATANLERQLAAHGLDAALVVLDDGAVNLVTVAGNAQVVSESYAAAARGDAALLAKDLAIIVLEPAVGES